MSRVIYFGMRGIFSIAPLEGLVAAGVDVCAVVVPAMSPQAEPRPRRREPPAPYSADLPVINAYAEHNIVHVAWAHHIPVWEVGFLSNTETSALLTNLRPDLITVACFPQIFPAALLQLPGYGCLNLHPSLLPAYRGPVPIFWMARHGEPQAGITLHFLSDGVDSGEIVSQAAFAWPDGITNVELQQRCATAGADLLVAAVQRLERDGALPRRPQLEADASYFSWPTEEHFQVDVSWPARRAFNFLRAANDWPLTIDIGPERYHIRSAVSYTGQSLGQPYLRRDDDLWVQLNPGVLRVQI